MIRRAAHLALAVVGAPLWLVFCLSLAGMVLLAVLGHRLWPAADRGNCWSFSLPRWWLSGGSLVVVPSGLWIGPIPVLHAAWVPTGPVQDMMQTEPETRVGETAPWWRKLAAFWYFKFTVETDDERHRRWRWRIRRNSARKKAAGQD